MKPSSQRAHSSKNWILVFGTLTAIYILVEFAFNAELVAFASDFRVEGDLSGIARKGEILSGLGLAIMLMSLLERFSRVSARVGFSGAAVLLGALAYGGVMLMSWLQPTIVDHVVASSSAQDRAKALNMMLFKHGAAEGAIVFDGRRVGDDPADKVMLALLGPLAFANDGTQEKLLTTQQNIIAKLVVIDNKGADVNSWEQYQKVSRAIRSKYDEYVKQATRANDLRGGSPGNATEVLRRLRTENDARFSSYLKASQQFLRANPRASAAAFQASVGHPPGLDKTDYLRHSSVCREATASMRSKGVPVDSGWCPINEGAVIRALERKSRDSVASEWNRRSNDMFGQVVEKNLTERQFRELPAIKRLISHALTPFPCSNGNAYLSAQQFKDRCVLPELQRGVNSLLEVYNADVDELADGGRYEQRGRAAVQALVIPPLAIAFSLFFSLLAVTRIFGRFRFVAAGLLIIVPIIMPAPNSDVTNHFISGGHGEWSAMGLAIRWVMSVEPFVFTIFQVLVPGT